MGKWVSSKLRFFREKIVLHRHLGILSFDRHLQSFINSAHIALVVINKSSYFYCIIFGIKYVIYGWK